MKIVLIRHGSTKGNLEKRYIGRTDEPLCKEGIESLEKSAAAGKYPAADWLFVSPLLRCIQTAEIIYGNQERIVVPELCEMDFGDFEGKNYQQLKDDSRYQEWIDSNGTKAFPGGESQAQFVERTFEGYKKILELVKNLSDGFSSYGKTAAIVCHGGSIMAILSSLGFGSYFDFMVKNGEGYVINLEENKCCAI